MHARITHYKMKDGARDEAVAIMNRIRDDIMALPGMQHFINAGNADGSGYIVALVTDKATSDANMDKVAALWANFSQLLEAKPEAEGFDVLANWSA